MLSMNKGSFISSFPNCIPFISFPCLIALAKNPSLLPLFLFLSKDQHSEETIGIIQVLDIQDKQNLKFHFRSEKFFEVLI